MVRFSVVRVAMKNYDEQFKSSESCSYSLSQKTHQ